MENNVIKEELSEVKKLTNIANQIYADKFLEKSLLLKIQTKKIVKHNSRFKKTKVYADIRITNTNSKKTKQYKILMFKKKNNKNPKIKKYNYDLLNEFLNLILYKNEFALILFLLKHIKRIKRTHNNDYSLHYFIILFAIMIVLAIIYSIYLGKLKDVYFHRILINNCYFPL